MKIYYTILLILIGCSGPSLKEDVTFIQITDTNIQDKITYTVLPDSVLTFPKIFQKSYYPNSKYESVDINCIFYNYNAGELLVESGKLLAGDPVTMHHTLPFKNNFPIGRFPVQLAMAKMKNDERVAFSRVLFSDSLVVKWEYALLPGQSQIPLMDTMFYCYGVDTGTGVFIDSIANNSAKHFDPNTWEHIIIELARKNDYKGHSYSFENHNLITFSTGYGDGCYATYVGYNEQNEICQLLTDFGLIPWWENKILE